MVVAVVGIRRSRTGRVLIAIRENERAASAFGVNPRTTTLQAFAISGFLAAFAGALFVHQQNGLQLDSYGAGESLVVFTMVVIGGLGSVPGALLGALFVRGVTWWLPVEWQILATGAGMLVVLLVFRGGFGAAFADLRDALLRRVARRRGIAVPSLTGTVVAATRADDRRRPRRRPTRALQVRGLAAEHDGVPVLDGIDLDARAGEIVALLGTNGSGKSTLLDTVAGVHRSSGGRVTVDGVDTTRTRAERLVGLGVAEAPADHGVFPSLTVRENLRLATWRARDRAASRASLADVLELFPRLDERATQRAGDLSGGEQHMLTLAMALVAAPRLLLVDELSLGLAPRPPVACRSDSERCATRAWPSWSSNSRSTGRSRSPTARCSSTAAPSATRARRADCSTGPTSCGRRSSARPRPSRRHACAHRARPCVDPTRRPRSSSATYECGSAASWRSTACRSPSRGARSSA